MPAGIAWLAGGRDVLSEGLHDSHRLSVGPGVAPVIPAFVTVQAILVAVAAILLRPAARVAVAQAVKLVKVVGTRACVVQPVKLVVTVIRMATTAPVVLQMPAGIAVAGYRAVAGPARMPTVLEPILAPVIAAFVRVV